MKNTTPWPEGSTQIRIDFGPVFIDSGSWSPSGLWTVWDPRPVRQGARMIEDNLTLEEAVERARALLLPGEEQKP